MKTPMSSDTKLTKDEECESVDSTKYRGMIGTTHLGLWYPKGTGIETVVYANSDHAGDYVDRKSTSGICTFVGCCLTSWFSKKQTALAISTTEAEYVSAEKACQQALWMKQALIDYDIRLDDVPIMCDNKGAIDLSKNPVQHSRTKHIKIRHHFLRDNVQKGHISIEKVTFIDNIADILTKPLKRESFNYLRLGLGMMEHITLKLYVSASLFFLVSILRKDRGMRRGRHSTSFSSAFDQPFSSHLNDDDDENDERNSRASTPSPIRFVNSLTNEVPQGMEVGSIRRIQGIGYGVLEFLVVGTTYGYADIFLMDTAVLVSNRSKHPSYKDLKETLLFPQVYLSWRVLLHYAISANNAKFPYLEKDKYEIWAMKMEYWIQNADHNLWRIVQQGNSPKRLGKDAKGNTIVHPPVSLDEHVAVQRENKVRTLLLQALPEDHMPDFHHYDDARDIWMAVKARFGGNEESKKMRKTMLKQQFTEFSVTEEEGLHKGYDRFQKILSQLNQVQARPDNDDINLKFLRALPSSWSQVALALKTRGGLESMSFDDLYNKLRSLELDVRIGHSYGVKAAAAPTHSAFIGAASSGSKLNYSNQQSIVPSVSQTSGRSDNIMECVLHSFVAENEPDQDMIYEDFDQVDQLEMEELDLKWQMAMLSLRINRFEKKAGRKMNYNNQQPARFDRRKVRCYKCLQLGHFARECNVKTVDDKARYSAFKVTEVKTDEPKALVSVDSMVNWSDHVAENKTGEVEKVYGMMAGLHVDNGGTGVSDDATSEVCYDWEFLLSDKSSDSETYASCDSSLKTKTKDFPPAVDIKTFPESDVEDPNSTAVVLVKPY
ncbi:ribonuclease H-like domain-containing protein [Tanacetum coccineum]